MDNEKLEIIYKPVDDLIPYARNARTHSESQVAQIASSIKEFGFTNPILLDGENGIIAGHGRCLAAQKLGLTEVPTIELSHLTDAQKRAYILADNRLALEAGWDEELLRLELDELTEAGFDLSLTGFTEDEINEFMAQEHVEEAEDAEIPEPPKDPKSVQGDVWNLGVHRLMCGDSTSIDSLESLMGGGKS